MDMGDETALETATNAVAIFVNGGLDATLAEIERKAREVPRDISTADGRKLIASTAYKIARSKTALDDMGKALVADTKKQIAVIDAERRRAREFLESLQAEIRAPLTEYEDREKARVAAHEAAISAMISIGNFSRDTSTAETRAILESLAQCADRTWDEFESRAISTYTDIKGRLQKHLAACEKRDAEQAELARLRAEAEQRAREERERRIAEEAAARAKAEAEAAAEKARLAAEAKAAAERKAIEDAARKAREDAEAAARKVKAEADAKLRAAEARARAEREAAEKAKREAEAAVERERQRAEAERQRAEAEAAARARNEARRAQVIGQIEEALRQHIGDQFAVKVAELLVSGQVPHTKVMF